MLIDKALKGQNGIIREKYLTFSCEASNYEQGVQVLSRIEADVQANMKRLGCINWFFQEVKDVNLYTLFLILMNHINLNMNTYLKIV